MISPHDANHRARIDEFGNIILPGAEPMHRNEEVARAIKRDNPQEMEEGLWYSPALEESLTLPWTRIEDDQDEDVVDEVITFVREPLKEEMFEEEPMIALQTSDPILAMLAASNSDDNDLHIEEAPTHVWNDVRQQMFTVTNDMIGESARQYQASVVDGIRTSKNVVTSLKHGTIRLWGFLTQPVWVPGRKNEPKQYSRSVLFLLDTVRFGGTFASLFVVLFVSLNFQSFWSIATAYVNPLADITGGKELSSDLNQGLADKLKKIPSLATAGADDQDLVSYLPEVGPPTNRLIIPKLNLNVPIVIPPNTNLLKEDWKGLEDDIQKGLQDGVVHYPGTARPGQAGNFFLTGHSSYFPWAPGEYKSVFARLDQLNVGDEYWVYYGGDKYRYKISEKKEIKPSDVSVLDQPVSKRISTLMTCTPVGTTLRRLIISSQEVDPDTDQPMAVGEKSDAPKQDLKMEALPI